jgi:chromosome segregation ATPase
MSNKNDLSKQILSLQKSIEDLKKRRATLAADSDRTATAIDDTTKKIGAALLEARDTTRESDALTRLKRDLEGLKEAVILADQRIEAQEAELAQVQGQFFQIDFEAAKDETMRLLLECVSLLQAANQAVEAIGPRFAPLRDLAIKSGRGFELDDHLPLLEKVYQSLSNDWGGDKSIQRRIEQIEQAYPALMTYARAKKSEKGW